MKRFDEQRKLFPIRVVSRLRLSRAPAAEVAGCTPPPADAQARNAVFMQKCCNRLFDRVIFNVSPHSAAHWSG